MKKQTPNDIQFEYNQFPSEYVQPENDILKVFEQNGFYNGRMISGSKSGYRNMHPNNKVVFNANVITKSKGKVWYGDIDITIDEENLKKIANEIKEDLYILYEMDARFGTENSSIETLIKKAVQKIPYEA
jgi:hypothetical protein